MQKIFIFFCVFMLFMSAHAATIIGSSTLMSQSYANQLEAWLGEGSISVSRVFYKQTGDGLTSTHFHNAVDGQGRTFTLLRVSSSNNQIVGGYNQVSWRSNGTYNFTPYYGSGNITDGTSFLFNLSAGTLFRQNWKLGNTNGAAYYEAYNHTSYGPTWGGGHDLYVDSTLQSGYGYASYSYGTYNWSNQNLTPGYSASYTYSVMEVYTINNVVPEPASMVLFALGCALFFVRKIGRAHV